MLATAVIAISLLGETQFSKDNYAQRINHWGYELAA